MKTLLNRIYADYLMPSRLGEYERLLERASGEGYTHMTVRSFFRALNEPGGLPDKVVVHRHDIDSDLRTARKMFEIERKRGVAATYYFRLSTLDFAFMREIEAAGGEASYHYEEAAYFAKRHRLRDADAVRQRYAEIRELFAQNFEHIAKRLGLPMVTVASHGDFVNRRLRLINHELLQDPNLRRRCGIECESYDRALLDHVQVYISDTKYPTYYKPVSPFDALGRHARIMILTHPTQWETNWADTTRCNMRRLAEELAWRV
jgi:hypothetical protein